MRKFSVVVTEEVGSPYPEKQISTTSEGEAIKTAEKLASEQPEKLVFIEFFRTQDGQHGYLNRGGFSISGQSWT